MYIYSMSYNEKREIAILMLHRASLFSVLLKWTDDGSLSEQKLVTRVRLQVAGYVWLIIE